MTTNYCPYFKGNDAKKIVDELSENSRVGWTILWNLYARGGGNADVFFNLTKGKVKATRGGRKLYIKRFLRRMTTYGLIEEEKEGTWRPTVQGFGLMLDPGSSVITLITEIAQGHNWMKSVTEQPSNAFAVLPVV
jgi:hypothetical protein